MSDTSVSDKVGEVVSKTKSRFGRGDETADVEGRPGIVRDALRKLGDGDIDGFLAAMDDDVTWEAPGAGNFPGGGEHSGTEAVKEHFIGDAGRTYTEFGFEPENYLDADDAQAVVVIGRFVGKGVEGDNLDVDAVQVWEFQGDDTAIRVATITDSAAFPEVITEKKQKEFEEEDSERERKEREKDAESEGEDKTEAKGEDKTEAKGESDDDEKSKDEDSDDD
jgi:ketosteroid isomerase-like protein